jgi:ribosomal protein S18 acetylase RimI-like enzyme
MEHDLTTIRVATGDDVSLLSELSATTFREAFAHENSPEDMEAYLKESFSQEQLTRELSDPAAAFFIAELSGKLLGYAKLLSGEPDASVRGSNPVELVRLYVLPESIGHGVGAALMEACIRESKERGFKTLWLGVWEHNPRAIRFYQKWGFQEVGSHIFQLGSDAQTDLIMQKSLEDV